MGAERGAERSEADGRDRPRGQERRELSEWGRKIRAVERALAVQQTWDEEEEPDWGKGRRDGEEDGKRECERTADPSAKGGKADSAPSGAIGAEETTSAPPAALVSEACSAPLAGVAPTTAAPVPAPPPERSAPGQSFPAGKSSARSRGDKDSSSEEEPRGRCACCAEVKPVIDYLVIWALVVP